MRALAILGASVLLVGGCILVTDFDVTGGDGNGGSAAGNPQGGGGGDDEPECTFAAACPTHASDNFCQVTTCEDQQCIVSRVAPGTQLNEQVLGDCKKQVCGDDGQITTENDDEDKLDDANECTIETCADGVPDQTFADTTAPCGNGLFCNGNGQCAGCVVADECPPDTLCAEQSCNGGICEVSLVADGDLCIEGNNGVFCDGPERCQNNQCVSSGDPCAGPDGDANCKESCNEATDSCTANDPDQSPCDDGDFCSGDNVCDSGQCVQKSGSACVGPDGDANCRESCDAQQMDCSAPDPEDSPCMTVGGPGCCRNGFCLQAMNCQITM